MKLSVFKDNLPVQEIDLGLEIEGNDNSQLTFLIGRSEECHIVLEDKMVSREHAEVVFDGSEWKIVKAAEFGQLIINGSLLEDKVLNTGDMISIGPYLLNVFVPVVAPVAAEVATDVTEDSLEEEAGGELEEADDPLVEELDGDLEEPLDSEELDDDGIDGEELDGGELDGDDEFGGDLDESEDSDEESSDEAEADFGDEFETSDDADGEESSDDGELFGDDDSSEESDEDSDDGFGDEGGFDMEASDEGDDDDVGSKTQVFTAFAKFELEVFGEFAPYDKFTIDDNETFIGRDASKCQIVLKDPEVSSVHAVIKRSNIILAIEDQRSQNGTILNGERINASPLTNNDEILIGTTTFTVKIISSLIEDEADRLMPVEENQVIEVEEILEVDASFEDEEGEEGEEGGLAFGEAAQSIQEQIKAEKSLVKKIKLMWSDPKEKKKLIYGGVILAMILLFSGEEPAKKPIKKGKKDKNGKYILDDGKAKKAKPKNKALKKLTPEQLEFVAGQYELAKELMKSGNYRETILELDRLHAVISVYKNSKQIYSLAKQGLDELERIERERIRKQREAEKKKKVKELLIKTKEAVKNRQVALAKSLFQKISELDPENFELQPLKLELEEWEKEEERKRVEEAAKKAERKRKVAALQPGKSFYLQKEWYRAVLKLEDFLKLTDMDEDLIKEASTMLKESKDNLNNIVAPLLGKARSLSEGQDLKGSYENYKQILDFDPSNIEALNEMSAIREKLFHRSRKVYREAIISESLSLFEDAKEKFQEVQQISPSDSDYYKKATEKLKDYID
ncbi:MAG: FHA domain-containing protein [Halobacteriovoraceae bacterium]|nr:FHA domain-containing protein [Halobacteriovoraceae bacterium]